MTKSIVFFLLFHICVGIVSPAIAISINHSIEESMSFMSAEKDQEMEEEEVDKTVLFFSYSINKCSKNTHSLLAFWKQNSYQEIFLNRLKMPPEFIV